MSSADRVSLFSSKSPSFFSNLVPLSLNFSWPGAYECVMTAKMAEVNQFQPAFSRVCSGVL